MVGEGEEEKKAVICGRCRGLLPSASAFQGKRFLMCVHVKVSWMCHTMFSIE